MCDNPSISRDHCPPVCFFPEQKDVGSDYRQNLIKVPSCAEHNMNMSKDDEYAMAIIAGARQANEIGKQQFNTKVDRAFKHSDPFMHTVVKHPRIILRNQHQTYGLDLDKKRFYAEMRKIACGIFFYEFREKWLLPIEILSTSLTLIEGDKVFLRQFHSRVKYVKNRINWRIRKGNNTSVFYYNAHIDPQVNAVRLIFYEGFEVIAYTSPDTKVPTLQCDPVDI